MKATLRALRRRAVCALRPRAVVLAYHNVAERGTTAPWVTVSPRHFAEQMAYLADSGLAISLDELLSALRTGIMPRGGVLVTFDDATADTANIACPILRHVGVPATLFVPTGLVGGRQDYWWHRLYRLARAAKAANLDLPGWLAQAGLLVPPAERRPDQLWRSFRFLDAIRREELLAGAARWLDEDMAPQGAGAMTWDQLAQLDGEGLFTFGAHTFSHPVLAGLAPDRLATEIDGSRSALTRFRSFRNVFAYPYGDPPALDETAVHAVRSAGFDAAFTTSEGPVRAGSDMGALDRVCISDMALRDFRWVVDHFLTK